MTQTPQSPQHPEPLESRVIHLERSMTDLRAAAEALLQTAQIHQRNFETVTVELQAFRQEIERIRQQQLESDQRFEIMLAEFRQLKIESEARFNGMQTEIRRLIDRLFNQSSDNPSEQ